MKDWLKGLIILIAGNIIYEVIPVWVVGYLLEQPNPLYSLGTFLDNIPRLQDIVTGNLNSSTALFMGLIGFGIIAYGLFLFIRDVYRYS
jgi:hypothetical protein